MINKIFSLILSISVFYSLHSQDVPSVGKSFILGGSVNFSSQKNSTPFQSLPFLINGRDDSKYSYFSASPYFGKQINNHFVLGLSLDYSTNKSTFNNFDFGGNEYLTVSKTNQIGFELFGRYVFYPDKTFNFYIQPYAGYSLQNSNSVSDTVENQEQKATYISAGIGIGMLYNINETWRLTLSSGGINYINGSWDATAFAPVEKFNRIYSGLSLSNISFGLELKL
jgi:hypothetical protein